IMEWCGLEIPFAWKSLQLPGLEFLRGFAWRRHGEPFLEQRIQLRALQGSDVRTMGRLGRLSLHGAFADDETQAIGNLVPLINLLQSFPHGVVRLVPAELVGVNEAARGDGADDHPRHEAVTG